ncbi:HNH endonuclease [Sinorhizobium sp. 22678]|uniref:HNH endonuclease n=1 Tax=Sinorhizobium sp. 22678 TaxID=3453955 RepID=UPI003F86779E
MVDRKPITPHRLVCKLVKGEPPTDRHEAAHSCGNGHLGCVNPNHLEWKTRSENQLDRVAHGTSLRGERHLQAKLTEREAREIWRLKGVKRQTEIAAEFGVTRYAIYCIHNQRSWAWIHEGAQNG